MDYALLLGILACIAVGVVSAVVRTWSLHQRTYSLEDRVAILEGTLTREVKTRAAQARVSKPDKDLELLSAVNQAPVAKKNWWETGLPRSAGG
jgi:hypothetical protein